MGSKDLVFDLTPTQSAFVHSDAHIVMLKGPMGEGKTYASVPGVIRHAVRCGKDIRGALIRDTHTNIKTFTVPSIKEILGNRVSFHDDHRKMVIHTTPKIEMDLFGIDDPGSLSKLQGPEYAIIWLEEPAPIIEKANAGLPKEVFDMAVARAARQTGTVPRIQISQNPADEDHWTEEVAAGPRIYEEDEETGLQIIKEVFNIPYGENSFLNPLARVANKAAFKNDPGKYARYVLGIPAPVQMGKRVTPQYNPMIHYLKDRELPVVPGAIGIRFWDAWQNPCCVVGQLIPPGKLWIHDLCFEENTGVRELTISSVRPLLETSKFKGKIQQWRDIGDPSMRTPDQSTKSQSAARTIESLLKTRLEPGPTRWNARIDPLRTALQELASDGQPKILLSKSAYLLHRALNGGWHFKTDNNGNIIGNLPDKDRHSHPGDALSYGVAVVFPHQAINYEDIQKAHKANKNRRAMSYASAFARAAR